MRKIPLAKAEPGMILEKPVMRDNGMILVAEGAELTPALLERLDNMGVEIISVKGLPPGMDGPVANEAFRRRIESLDRLFRKYSNDAWMMRLKNRFRDFYQLKAALCAPPAPEASGPTGEGGNPGGPAGKE